MSYRSPIPVIFLTFARLDSLAGELPSLASEARVLRDAFLQIERRGACEVVVRENVAPDDIIKVFQDPAYRNRIAVFHYAGHADRHSLFIEFNSGSSRGVDASAFASFLAQQPGLHLVFLNGCDTGGQVPLLQAAGIPVVLSTSDTDVDDEMACVISECFYRSLAAGSTIERAYSEAKARYEMDTTHGECPWLLHRRDRAASQWTITLPETQPAGSSIATHAPSSTGNIQFDWVQIEAGRFIFEEGDRSRKRYLSAFAISRTPVTNSQYGQFVNATGYRAPVHWMDSLPPHEKELHPVVNVSLTDAQEFCRWAGVRLPTEIEWEKAARGCDGRAYPWGNELPDARLCNHARTYSDTTPVDTCVAGASPFGCTDMAGNVWEWTSSEWTTGDQHRSQNTSSARARRFTVRGGSFRDGSKFVTCFARVDESESCIADNLGFRVVKSQP